MPEGEIDLEPVQPNTCRWRLLLFGASGAVGQAVAEVADAKGWSVTGVSRSQRPDTADRSWVQYDPAGEEAACADGDRPVNSSSVLSRAAFGEPQVSYATTGCSISPPR